MDSEIAQAFNRLGSNVALLEGEPRILPKDEPEASEVLAQQMRREGLDLRLGTMVERVGQTGAGFTVTSGGQEVTGDGSWWPWAGLPIFPG